MSDIPSPKLHPEVAINQHLVPQCYMRQWSYNRNKSVWIFDKNAKLDGEKTDWRIESKKIEKIKLSIAGVCVTFNNSKLEIVKNLIIYLAGPLANICLAILFYKINFIFEVNIFLALLNLMPIYPLDGYNILNIFFNKSTIKNVENIFLSLLFLISVFILIGYFNPSLFIFFVYVMLIKYVTKNHIK